MRALTLESAVRAVVADLGLSRIRNDSKYMTKGQGSPAYMAPEVIGGIYDERADVFSFAVVVYEMLSGKRPWEQLKHGWQVQDLVLDGKRPDLSVVPPDRCPVSLNALLQRCWSPVVPERPYFLEILTELSPGGPLRPASPSSALQRSIAPASAPPLAPPGSGSAVGRSSQLDSSIVQQITREFANEVSTRVVVYLREYSFLEHRLTRP